MRIRWAGLVAELHELGHTMVAVLHELNQPGGTVAAVGDPAKVVTAELVQEVFGLRCHIIEARKPPPHW